MNSTIIARLQNNDQPFEEINVESSYWEWLNNFVDSLYDDYYYQDFSIPDNKKHAIPNLNVLATPIRITQRRMNLVENTDKYTKDFIKDGWASLGFDITDTFDPDVETSASFGTNGTFVYQLKDTFFNKGGYLQEINIMNLTQEDAQALIQSLQDDGFIDRQTRSIVVDLILYNSYTDVFTVINFVAIFEANGLITTKIFLYNVKRDYYSGGMGYFRLVCEICFVLLLIFYLIIEVNEIVGDITDQKKEFEKELKKKQARENRKKELQDSLFQPPPGEGEGQTPDLPKGGYKDATPMNFQSALDKTDSIQVDKKKMVFHYFSFVVKGFQQHYNDGWNWIDSFFLMLSVVAVGFWASIISKHIPQVSQKSFTEISSVESNEVLYEVADQILTYSRICSINFILIFIKVLKYLASWFERVMIIFKTLAYAKSDIFYFLIMYIIIFFAFVVMCHIYYGADLTAFGTIFASLKTLFLMLLGELGALDDMIVLNKVLSFFFFIAFMTSMQFILINMFIAFISNAYSAVNESISSSKKLEDELKQKHLVVRLAETINWMKRKLSNDKARKEREKIKAKKNQELLKKNMNKKVQMIMKNLQKKKIEEEDNEEKDPNELRKERFLFGNADSDRKKKYLVNEGEEPDNEEGILNSSGIDDKKSSNSGGAQTDDKKNGTTNSNDLNSKVEELNDDEDNDSLDEDVIAKSKQKLEEEKSKIILTRKEWDKNFDQNQFFVEEPLIPALLSEKQDVQGKKDRELKCGKIMWASITFTLYAALYITLILFQLNVERNFWYNTAFQNAISGLEDSEQNTIESIQNYGDLVRWLNESFPTLASEITQEETNFTGYYIQDVNYVLGDKFRMCFKISGINQNESSDNIFQSEYYKDDHNEHEYTENFIGSYSNIEYVYSAEGYQKSGSYCQEITFQPDDYARAMEDFINDRIISDRLLLLTFELVTFEASQYVHTYSTIQFSFPSDGSVKYEINIFTMKLNQYKTQEDLIRLGFEGLYILLLLYNMAIFVKKLINKSKQYQRWKRIEIDSLSEIERRQRYQKKPEWLRQVNALITAFTYFDLVYFSLAITSIALWILYIQGASVVDFSLPPSEENKDFIPKFYEVQRLLMNYTNVVAINTIFLSVKVFDYMNKSKHMNMLSNTLYSSKEDTFYFLIIFAIFLFGFVGMSYISFGPQLEDFNTLGNAIRKCFEITIGDFDYDSLEQVNEFMAVIFFFPFSILFVFILTNIFLAIINEAYEANQLSSEDYDHINFLQSIFYCMIPTEKQRANRRKSAGLDKKSAQNDYLEVFEKQVVNLQISMSDLKTWAFNCADEIKSELKKRTQLRHENREILLNKYKKMKSVEEGKAGGTGVVGQGKRFDEVECYKKRLQYWDYIRNGIQFISFQNRILNAVLKQKEKEIQEKTEQYYKEKQMTLDSYKYLALLEKPVEDRLELIMNYRKVLSLLEQEKNLLIKEEEKDDEEEEEKGDKEGEGGASTPSNKKK